MICRCIDDFNEFMTIDKEYELWLDGVYYGFRNDIGRKQYLTKEQFELYFEAVK